MEHGRIEAAYGDLVLSDVNAGDKTLSELGASLGSWTTATKGSSTQAATDGFIIIYTTSANVAIVTIKVEAGDPTPDVVRVKIEPTSGDGTDFLSAMCPVAKDSYYLIEASGVISSVEAFWMPLS